MADQNRGSFAREIDPDGSIKGPDLTAAFDRVRDGQGSQERPGQIASEQVANTSHGPREPAPSSSFNQAKSAEHKTAMGKDDKAAKDAALKAKAELFMKQDAARQIKDQSQQKARGLERGD